MTQAAAAAATPPIVIGRYALFDELAAGGMATVHLGRLLGPVGFGRTVAIKRLHAHFLKDPEFLTMFMDEARIVSRIRHPNVVPMVDVVQSNEGLLLVMEYVHGDSLSRLMRNARKADEAIPQRIIAAIMSGTLHGLHAAHETKGTDGQLLGVVHRDVSPQNVIVGADGTAHVLDFGIAKAAGRAQVTREGQIKGKLAYMAPEQIRGQVDRRTDVFAASVVLWEMLAGRRLHDGAKDIDIVTRVVKGDFDPPSRFRPGLAPELDTIVMRGLATSPSARFETARDMARDLERSVGLASPSEVSAWVEHLAHDILATRLSLVSSMELAASDLVSRESLPPAAPVPAAAVSTTQAVFSPADREPRSGDIPSSSSVFVHAETATFDAPPAEPAKRPSAWYLIALFVLLATSGVVLGTWSLLRRASGGARPAPVSAPSASPSASTVTTVSAEPAPPTTAVPSSDEKRPTVEAKRPPFSNPASSPSPSPLPKVGAASAAAASASASSKKAKPPPACEPPFTLDDVGHRHYKPECMGSD